MIGSAEAKRGGGEGYCLLAWSLPGRLIRSSTAAAIASTTTDNAFQRVEAMTNSLVVGMLLYFLYQGMGQRLDSIYA